jgi:cell division protein FtsW
MGTGTLTNWLESIGIELPRWGGKRPVRLGFDWVLLTLVICLVVFGLLMVYSASADFSYQQYGSETYTIIRQIRFVFVGAIAALCFSMLNYHSWRKLAPYAMLAVIILLFYVQLAGEERLGATRSFAGGSYQPSELAKLVMILYLSVWLFSHREDLNSFSLGLLPLGVILGFVGLLILWQPDLSAFITVIIMGALLFFLASKSLRQVLYIGFIASTIVLPGFMLIPTGKKRIAEFLAGWKDVLLSSEHVKRGMEAFLAGGWLGVGIGKGQAKLVALPFPHTDSIFAVIGEEVGAIGALILMLVYLALLWRGMRIARRAPDVLGRLMAGGLTFWIVFEAMLNMGVIIGALPFAGNALPFISSGGSNLVVSLSAIGILINISRHAEQVEGKKERTFNAVVDLRGRDRRRRVSGAVNSTSVSYRK